PVVKGWSTETGIEVASLGVQIHGGMGFIEETGAAQYLRDARITTIYEGTTGIQANDLIGRKIAREGGATIKAVVGIMKQVEAALAKQPGEEFAAIHAGFARGVQALAEAATHIASRFTQDIKGVHVGAVPFLRLMGIVSGGWQMARAALVAQQKLASGEGDARFYQAKIATARFYADHLLSQAPGLATTVVSGGAGALAIPEEAL
ncbi:MAG: acyl-CoA dehydrogenase, partial [Rhodocyclaceae bacterium]|nr:acyl-CoA dehydrogenase [Rhodocyclaceae bacterium]